MPKILVFDTETTGLPASRSSSIYNTHEWPYVVQLSFVYYDLGYNNLLDYGDYIIQIPKMVKIEPKAQEVHGISYAITQSKGVPLNTALNHFDKLLLECDLVVGHNVSFDKRMIMVECIRNNRKQVFTINNKRKEEFCTMKESKALCKIDAVNHKTSEHYFKYPKLLELHDHLFKYVPTGLHDSLADVLCCLRCFIMMKYNRDLIYDNRLFASLWRQKCIEMT